MTEAEWKSCTDPERMLELLRGRVSDRKLRLFAAASCRRVWHLLVDASSRTVVELVEQVADGLRSTAAIYMARQDAMEAWETIQIRAPSQASIDAGYAAVSVVERYPGEKLVDTASTAARSARRALYSQAFASEPGSDEISRLERARVTGCAAEDQEAAMQAALMRCIFGNPFRPQTIDSTWRIRNGSTVAHLAQAIYEERAFDRLPILADALEDAGCTEQDILEHCRGGTEHVRGCWVVDLLTGRQ